MTVDRLEDDDISEEAILARRLRVANVFDDAEKKANAESSPPLEGGIDRNGLEFRAEDAGEEEWITATCVKRTGWVR